MGLKKKISLGFVIIGTILLLSSVISLYEFISMRRSVSNLISDNISSVNTSRLMLEVTDEYNFDLLTSMGIDSTILVPDIVSDTRFTSYLNLVKDNFTTTQERVLADSILYAYTTYIHVVKDAANVWQGDYQQRRVWYFDTLHPIYTRLRGYLQQLAITAEKALEQNSINLSDSFYRSIMPGVVAVAVGLILVLLFNYYINRYYISPLQTISKGIANFISLKKNYTVEIDGDDELNELNTQVKELINTNKNLTKQG